MRGRRGDGDRRFEDPQARGEDLPCGVGGPARGDVAFGAGEGRDGVDVHGGGDEEDALDGVRGEGAAGGGVDGLHCERCEGWVWLDAGGFMLL